MPLNYAALKTEIQTDPTGLGYAPLVAAGNDIGVANLLNEIRQTIDVRRLDINPQEVLEAIDVSHFISNPNQLAASWFESVTQLPTVSLVNPDGTDNRVMANFRRILTNGSTSETRVTALGKRKGSRAEQLFGTGTVISPSDVAIALRST